MRGQPQAQAAPYPLYRRLGGPQGRSGQVRKISPPPRFDPRTVQPVGSRYTDWSIPAHWPKFNPFKIAALHEENTGSEDLGVKFGAEVGTSVFNIREIRSRIPATEFLVFVFSWLCPLDSWGTERLLPATVENRSCLTLGQGFPNLGSRALFDWSRCESQNRQNWSAKFLLCM